jgi:hypothetical protein
MRNLKVKGLTEKDVQDLHCAAYLTWSAIAADCEAAIGKPLSMSATIEVVIDADHILFHGGRGRYMHEELYKKFKSLSYTAQKNIVRDALFNSR